MGPQRFQIHSTAKALTPGAEGLWHALSDGWSIHARQTGDIGITGGPGDPPWVYCETSGSTGKPKVIRRSPHSWIASFAVNQRLFNIQADARYGVLGSLGHSLSLYAAVEALHLGAGLALMNGQRPDAKAAALRAHNITHLYATPSQLRLLTAADAAPYPALSHVICGGGALTAELRATLQAHCPHATITEFFGASETSFIALSQPDTPPGAVGKAYPGVALRIAAQPPDTVGEIWVQSPYLFDGYEKGDSTDTTWDGDALAIGELGRLDLAGNLYLCGRRSRMVTVADHNVYPEAVEAVLLAQPEVTAACVIALPDPLRGHRIVAAVEGTADAAQLRMACRTALGAQAVPKDIRVVDRLPMLPAGKPDLAQLRALWEAGHNS